MPPAPKVTRPQIEATLRAWQGNVEQSARELGVAKSILYRKAKALGIDLGLIRSETTFSGQGLTTRNTSDVSGQLVRIGAAVMEDKAVTSAIEAGARILESGMDKAATVLEGLRHEIGKRAANQPARLRPENAKRLTDLRYEMTAKLRGDLSDTALLNQFFSAYFEEFVRDMRQSEEQAG